MRLTKKQISTLHDLSKEYGDLTVGQAGPLMTVTVYVQSASSAGNTIWYYNSAGDEVRV